MTREEKLEQLAARRVMERMMSRVLTNSRDERLRQLATTRVLERKVSRLQSIPTPPASPIFNQVEPTPIVNEIQTPSVGVLAENHFAPVNNNPIDVAPLAVAIASCLDRLTEGMSKAISSIKVEVDNAPVANAIAGIPAPVVDMAPVAAAVDRMGEAIEEMVASHRESAKRQQQELNQLREETVVQRELMSEMVKALVGLKVNVPQTPVTIKDLTAHLDVPERPKRTIQITHSDGSKSTIEEV